MQFSIVLVRLRTLAWLLGQSQEGPTRGLFKWKNVHLKEATVAKISIMPTKYVGNMDFFHPKKKNSLLCIISPIRDFFYSPWGAGGWVLPPGCRFLQNKQRKYRKGGEIYIYIYIPLLIKERIGGWMKHRLYGSINVILKRGTWQTNSIHNVSNMFYFFYFCKTSKHFSNTATYRLCD